MTVALVSALKNASATSCPWDLAEFGSTGNYISHWRRSQDDGGRGNCLPAGDAASAFCFFAGWFALREKAPGAARIWLALALLAGITIGIAQQLRGARYMSHTMCTAWFCWVFVLASYWVLERSFVQRWFTRYTMPAP